MAYPRILNFTNGLIEQWGIKTITNKPSAGGRFSDTLQFYVTFTNTNYVMNILPRKQLNVNFDRFYIFCSTPSDNSKCLVAGVGYNSSQAIDDYYFEIIGY